MSAPNEDPMIGAVVLGRYRVVRLLAVGGMGAIYLARTEGAAGVTVPAVIKRVLPGTGGSDSQAVRQFVREAKILATLRHPGIVGILDFSDADGDYLMAMEYVHGHSLDRWLRYAVEARGKFHVELAMHVAIQVLDALHYAHTLRGGDGVPLEIIHRDVTPSNVLVDASGHVKLADFGIARSATEKTTDVTGDSSLKGKMPYIAPELFSQQRPTATVDVYSVAVLLHEVLLGKNEFSATHPVATMYNVLNVVPRRLDEARDDVTRAQADAIARGLEKDPAKRYATAQQFATALRAARTVDADQAQQMLAEEVARDFFSEKMAALTGVHLPTLDRSLREAVPAASSAIRAGSGAFKPAESSTDGATVVARKGRGHAGGEQEPAPAAPATAAPAAETKGARGLWIAVGVIGVLVLALGAGGVALSMRAQPSTQQVVYLEGSLASAISSATASGPASAALVPGSASAETAANAAPTAASAAPTAEPAASAETVTGAPTAGRPGRNQHAPPAAGSAGASPEELVRRAIGRGLGRIQRCFDEHPGALTAEGAVQLRFTIDARGAVTAADLSPAAIASGPAAPCVLGVVRGIPFGAQASTITLRTQFTVRPVRP